MPNLLIAFRRSLLFPFVVTRLRSNHASIVVVVAVVHNSLPCIYTHAARVYTLCFVYVDFVLSVIRTRTLFVSALFYAFPKLSVAKSPA